MKILFAAAEAAPFIKTGGLADVMGALPKKLAALGHDVRLVLPLYSGIGEKYKAVMKEIYRGDVWLSWRHQYLGVKELFLDGVHCYFIDNEQYFKRDGIYAQYDDGERFAYFSRAVLAMLKPLDFHPDILHCNDWHTGLIPVYLAEDFRKDSFYQNIHTVYTIHNLAYQGTFDRGMVGYVLGLPDALYDNGNLEQNGSLNYLKSGLVYADQVTTVSPTYAREITYPYYGEGLDTFMRDHQYKITGILNGLDTSFYNPETDPDIPVRYGAGNAAEGKRADKDALRRELGLPVRRGVPLLSMVTRLSESKGLDLVVRIMGDLVQADVQLVVLGTGDWSYEGKFRDLQQRHPDKVSAQIRFSEPLAHRIYAASDLFLMPSRFEPCGLSQMIALRYGTIPVVRATGGLKDSVFPYNPYTGTGNGLLFQDFNAHELLDTIWRGVSYYRNGDIRPRLVRNAMESDNSWDRSAQAYLRVYERAMGR